MRNLMCLQLLFVTTLVFTSHAQAQAADEPLAAWQSTYQNASPAPLHDRAAFIERPVVQGVKLAPDGRHLVYLQRQGLKKTLYLLDTHTLTSRLVFSSFTLNATHWAADSKALILELDDAIGLVALDRLSQPALIARLDAEKYEYFLRPDPLDSSAVLIVRRPDDNTFVVQRISSPGRVDDIYSSGSYIEDLLFAATDATMYVSLLSETQRRIVKITNGNAEQTSTCTILEQCRLLAFDNESSTLWLTGNFSNNLIGLHALAPDDEAPRLVHRDPGAIADLENVILAGRKPAVVQYQPGLLVNHALDADTQRQLDVIASQFPQSNITPALSASGSLWLLTEQSAVLRHPRYHLYDTLAGTFTRILVDESEAETALPAADLSRKIPLQYRAGDGLMIHGYVSLPKGRALRDTPLIALVHGGPVGRIDSNYADTTQLLVNRGYIVFEPNFRISTGYGMAYTAAANRDFGNGIVQQDILDGVDYLLSQGIGDAQQLAIVGASFGGFAVLTGLAYTPDKFKVGIASVPPADLGYGIKRLSSQSAFIHEDPATRAEVKLHLGDPDQPEDLLRLYEQSPQASLHTITAPLLIMAGADDDRVSISHVKDYSLALFNQNKTLSLFIDEDEGHGLSTRRGQLASLYMTEKFLALYLDGRLQPLDDPGLATFIGAKMLMNSNEDFVLTE